MSARVTIKIKGKPRKFFVVEESREKLTYFTTGRLGEAADANERGVSNGTKEAISGIFL